MIEPAEPDDEAERLAALRLLDILDTGPERAFDDIARVAKAIFGVPVALITLVDKDRQWFKARIGIDVTETPRASSFCAHAILRENALIVPDATEDPRFHDNPLVTGTPHVRFYAGQPLCLPDGHMIGALCVIDRTARCDPDPDQIEALEALGRLAIDAFALRALRAAEKKNG
jgi:GAF domain-containing protein